MTFDRYFKCYNGIYLKQTTIYLICHHISFLLETLQMASHFVVVRHSDWWVQMNGRIGLKDSTKESLPVFGAV